ncbi:MAG: manganese efflux pump MntP family protein [Campylobacteraceae bacterium]|jgi:putative Mn2+ efflux pump MntP|nr:manganese efflux pump MntP family protein [Campylobacteraceae bacterium]
MGLFEIVFIAVGLAMDAFAVTIVLGLSAKKVWHIIIPSVYFGFFQTFMPLIGYFGGVSFAAQIQDSDHWIALILLVIIGGIMIKGGFSKEKTEHCNNESSFGHIKLLILATATSIDALVVGTTFAFFKVDIYKAALIIGIITFFISTCGVIAGRRFGIKFKSKAEFTGGIILIAIGIKILIEHLFFQNILLQSH